MTWGRTEEEMADIYSELNRKTKEKVRREMVKIVVVMLGAVMLMTVANAVVILGTAYYA